MEIFIDIEKHILEATYKRYKWIARDENGCLYIYNTKPYKDEEYGFFSTKFSGGYLFNRCVSDVLFKNVTWENSPIQYRDNELLTSREREYLKFVFRPFASHIAYVQKLGSGNSEFIKVYIWGENAVPMLFPDFKKGTMYKGMKSEVKYELEELGIEYDE